MTEKPITIVAISGSTRFLDDMAVVAWECEKRGIMALTCHLLPASFTLVRDHLGEAQGVAEVLDRVHRRKIELADRLVVVCNEGYIGESTRREIEYAEQLGKPVFLMEHRDQLPYLFASIAS